MKTTIWVVFMVVLAGAVFCFANLKTSKTEVVQKPLESPAIQPTTKVCQPEPTAEKKSDILSDIRKARRMLEKKDSGYQIQEKKKKGNWTVKDFRVLLAVRHADGQIKIVSVDPKTKQTDQSGYIVDWNKQNGVNTCFSVIHPKNCAVLAIKRVVKDDKEAFKEVIYTPYSPTIDCGELRNAGLSYLKKTIKTANAQLRNVKSQTNPDLSVNQTSSEKMALVLAVIEHIDPDRLEQGESIESLTNEVLVILGANQPSAFNYAVSKAKARGLFQFIPGTYARIRNQYPEANLHKDFANGMCNHINAAKAAFLLFDSDLNYLNQNVLLQKDKIGTYLASAYNCGARRTAKEVKSHKKLWEHKLPMETRLYLKKFSAVWNSFIGA
ncbi:MAG: hypothetical protein A2Y98_01905 [Candidatus Portnoybacteria bacterium RBG_19FT_COMBO_36_7]|uniref:Transglycosylase SLT domain-containing protein n=1 Tax=Candidatus Portnoybacteria bacterium RBG_19FT_COMBO_36_7 TaxID=1801992 RepID=A0A1G2F6W1_9BACT|nr:MAG: hypothetical protein A2Y98_01905 [Candidatus Portnoybacteria bacterium RBG_19FT_COMBO_36_7]